MHALSESLLVVSLENRVFTPCGMKAKSDLCESYGPITGVMDDVVGNKNMAFEKNVMSACNFGAMAATKDIENSKLDYRCKRCKKDRNIHQN